MTLSTGRSKGLRRLVLSSWAVACAVGGTSLPAQSQTASKGAAAPIKVGLVTFLSGAAAGPFGVPARNGAELLVDALNAGKLPAPYSKPGLGGTPISLVFVAAIASLGYLGWRVGGSDGHGSQRAVGTS